MKGYAAREVFSQLERDMHAAAQRLVDAVPTFDAKGRWVRCHELVRALAPILALEVCDGHYGMAEHSWLWTAPLEPFESLPNIIDPYCPGRIPQVQLVHTSISLPFEYRRGDPRADIRDDVVQSLRVMMDRHR